MDINKITIIGRVGKAPEGRDVGKTRKVELRVANNRGKGREGDEKTNWYTVELWGPSGQFAEDYVRVGDIVCVSGSHLLDSYTNKDGDMVYLNLIQNAEIQKLNRYEDSGSSDRQSRSDDRPAQRRQQAPQRRENDW